MVAWAEKRFDNPEHAKAFVEWFGDSKVVDKNGDPLVVYHGTYREFGEFDNPDAEDLAGGWHMFSESPEYAGEFAVGKGGNIIPSYLNAENPLDLRELPARRGDVRRELLATLEEKGFDMEKLGKVIPYERDLFQHIHRKGARAELVRQMKERGFDSIVMPDSKATVVDNKMEYVESLTWVVLNPTQIKSATGNRGTFDPDNPKITESRLVEHLPGEHEQKKHGRRGGGMDAIAKRLGITDPKKLEIAEKNAELQIKAETARIGGDKKAEYGFLDQVDLEDSKVGEASHQRMAQILGERFADKMEPGDLGNQGLTLEEKIANNVLTSGGTLIFQKAVWEGIKDKHFDGNANILADNPNLDKFSAAEVNILAALARAGGDDASANSIAIAVDNPPMRRIADRMEKGRAENANSASRQWAKDKQGIIKSEAGNLGYQRMVHEVAGGVVVYDDGQVAANNGQRAGMKMAISAAVGSELDKAATNGGFREEVHAAADYLDREGLIQAQNRRMESSLSYGPESPAAAEALVAHINDSWAKSSTNGNETSIAFQKTIAKKFGMQAEVGAVSPDGDRRADELLEKHGKAFEGVVDAYYKRTQDELQRQGVESVVLYRGMQFDHEPNSRVDSEYKEALDLLENRTALPQNAKNSWVTDQNIEGNPVSSYSAHYGTAAKFGSDSTRRYNMLVASQVSAKDIFCTSVTGAGCLAENEVMVLRHQQDAKVMTIVNTERHVKRAGSVVDVSLGQDLPSQSEFWRVVENSEDI